MEEGEKIQSIMCSPRGKKTSIRVQISQMHFKYTSFYQMPSGNDLNERQMQVRYLMKTEQNTLQQ